MKFLVFGLLIAVFAIGSIYVVHPRTKIVSPCPFCYQDVTTATYLAFITLDCDGEIETNSTCADDLENVNLAPALNSVSIDNKGNVTVKLTILEITGSKDDFSFTFNKLGSLIS